MKPEIRLDLYPLPGRPSDPPTWEDIQRLSRHYPAAHHAIMLVQRGEWSREQALIALVYALADSFARLFKAEVDRKLVEPLSFSIVLEPPR